MAAEIPVAAALPILDDGEDPVVVEADQQGRATRAMKALARWLFRFVQELNWAGHEGAVVVGVVCETLLPPPIGVNLALLVSPLVTTAVGETAGSASAIAVLEADIGEVGSGSEGREAFVTPRDRVWIVPDDRLADAETRDLFELVVFEPAPGRTLEDIDLLLVVGRGAEPVAVPVGLSDQVEMGAVVVGSTGRDDPVSIPVVG
jgi:hypothetical protein